MGVGVQKVSVLVHLGPSKRVGLDHSYLMVFAIIFILDSVSIHKL